MRKRTSSMAVLLGLLLAFGITLPAFADPVFTAVNGAQKGTPDASVVLWDFEDGDISEWPGTADADLWMRENSVSGLVERGDWSSPFVTLYNGGQICPSCNTETFLATGENGGRVHGGENALGVTFDMRSVEFNSWIYGLIWNTQGNIVLRDTANGNDADALGMWLYVPEGFRSEKNRSALAFQLTVLKGANENSLSGGQLNLRYNGKNINSLQESDIPDNRWVYVTADLTGYNYVRLVDPADDIFRSPSFGRCYMRPSDAQVITFYLDDIELVYDDAGLDRMPPQILDPVCIAGAEEFAFGSEPVNENVLSFRAEVADAEAAAISGIDDTSAAILLDGCRLDDATVDEGVLSMADVAVADGAHTVTFMIADMAGNVTELKKDFIVRSEDGAITVSGHNDLNNLPQAGSVYYIDLNAADIAAVGSVTATLALNSANRWEPDRMIAAEGFTAAYTVNACEPNRLTVTVSGAAGDGLTGEQTLVSIPVRVWAYDESTWVEDSSNYTVVQMTTEERYNAYDEPVVTVEARTEFGKAVFTDGREETFSGAVSSATAVTGDKSNGMWHTHTAEALPDIAATCVSDGCVGRTYCAACGSFVDWGEKTSNGEHDYRFDSFVWNDDGTAAAVKLVCANDPAHVTYVDAEMSQQKVAPTCTEDAKIIYTATYGNHSENNEVTVSGTACHTYGDPVWTWTEEYTATVTFTCANNDDTVSPDVTVTSDVTLQPTATTAGEKTYTATAEFNGETYTDTRTEVLPATGETDDPGEQDTPDAPSGQALCKWCGEPHTGFWGKIVGFFHSILYFFAHLFGRR